VFCSSFSILSFFLWTWHWIVCHSSSTIFDYPFGIFVNYLSFFFYDLWLLFRYLLELSVILLLRFLITLSVSSWIVCHSSSTICNYSFGIFLNCLSFFFYDFWLPFRYLLELSVILLLQFLITLSVSSWIICHSSSMICDYPFGIFVNYLSFFFYDFWLPFRYLRELSVILLLQFLITLSVSSNMSYIYISVYLLIPVLACSICNGRTPNRLSCCWRINWD
jgi:hypothetical protein